MCIRKTVILYAEDESFIRDELVEILEMRYHKVLGAANGKEALELISALINHFSNSMDAYNENNIKSDRGIEIEAKKDDYYLHLRVEDRAGGIKDEYLGRIFDSYFTTKGEKGTGIGLNLVKMIVEDSIFQSHSYSSPIAKE